MSPYGVCVIAKSEGIRRVPLANAYLGPKTMGRPGFPVRRTGRDRMKCAGATKLRRKSGATPPRSHLLNPANRALDSKNSWVYGQLFTKLVTLILPSPVAKSHPVVA
jgi:hypothetical protein